MPIKSSSSRKLIVTLILEENHALYLLELLQNPLVENEMPDHRQLRSDIWEAIRKETL